MTYHSEAWKLHVTNDFMLGRDVVILYLPRPDGRTEFLKMINVDGTTEVEVADQDALPPMKGFALPNGVLEAIAEHVKPGPSQGEVTRLEDALAAERARVDMVLGAAAHVLDMVAEPATTTQATGPRDGVPLTVEHLNVLSAALSWERHGKTEFLADAVAEYRRSTR